MSRTRKTALILASDRAGVLRRHHREVLAAAMTRDAAAARTAGCSRKLALVALGMFGFGYALVPFYNQICDALGINSLGETRAAAGEHAGRLEPHRDDRVRLPTRTTCRGASGRSSATCRCIPGELTTVEYEVVQRAQRAGHRPGGAELRAAARGRVLQEARVLLLHAADAAPGETRRMPVVFVVDPKLPKDVNTHHAVVHVLRGRRGAEARVVMDGLIEDGAFGRHRHPPQVVPRARQREALAARDRGGGVRDCSSSSRSRTMVSLGDELRENQNMAHSALTPPLTRHGPRPRPADSLRGAAADALADHGLGLALPDGARRRVRVQRRAPAAGSSIAAGFMLLALHDGALVRRRDPRVRGRQVRPLGRRLVPLGHELVHLLRGDVLRRVLRRAVLGARVFGARPRHASSTNALHLAGLHRALALCRPGLRRAVHADGAPGACPRSTPCSCSPRASP